MSYIVCIYPLLLPVESDEAGETTKVVRFGKSGEYSIEKDINASRP